MPTTKSPSRKVKNPTSPLVAKLTNQQNVLQLNELDPSFAKGVVEQEVANIWANLPQDKTTKYHFERLLMFQHFAGFIEGLTAVKSARDTMRRWADPPAQKSGKNPPTQRSVQRPHARLLLRMVKKAPTMQAFLAKHGEKKIPITITTWEWLQVLRTRVPRPTWNDAADKSYPPTRKAFQVQFRRLQEHVIEHELAQVFLEQVVSLTERRKSKAGVRGKAEKKRSFEKSGRKGISR